MAAEIILAAPRKALFPAGEAAFQGVRQEVQPYLARLAANLLAVQRDKAEVDVTLKQPIPYVVLTCGDEVWAMERLPAHGETRLHGKISLGVGGHMNPTAGAWEQVLHSNLARELGEEVAIASPYRLEPLGLVNDDADAVGKHHIGLLYRAALASPAVRVRETDKLRGRWVPRSELPWIYARLETWSQFVADRLLSEDGGRATNGVGGL